MRRLYVEFFRRRRYRRKHSAQRIDFLEKVIILFRIRGEGPALTVIIAAAELRPQRFIRFTPCFAFGFWRSGALRIILLIVIRCQLSPSRKVSGNSFRFILLDWLSELHADMHSGFPRGSLPVLDHNTLLDQAAAPIPHGRFFYAVAVFFL